MHSCTEKVIISFRDLYETYVKSLSLCFYSKTGFDPRTAKSQPIWIKFCTHTYYCTEYTADLDSNRRVGGSSPNQNDYVFCNTCNAP